MANEAISAPGAQLVTFEEADAAAQALAERLDDVAWLRGVGVAPDDQEGFAVTIRVAPNSTPEIPARFRGVAVHVRKRRTAKRRPTP